MPEFTSLSDQTHRRSNSLTSMTDFDRKSSKSFSMFYNSPRYFLARYKPGVWDLLKNLAIYMISRIFLSIASRARKIRERTVPTGQSMTSVMSS